MQPDGHRGRIDQEHQDIREAISRIQTGQPRRSDGSATVVALAKEAGLSRARLYEHHPDLIREFKRCAPTRWHPPNEALQTELDEARPKFVSCKPPTTSSKGRLPPCAL